MARTKKNYNKGRKTTILSPPRSPSLASASPSSSRHSSPPKETRSLPSSPYLLVPDLPPVTLVDDAKPSTELPSFTDEKGNERTIITFEDGDFPWQKLQNMANNNRHCWIDVVVENPGGDRDCIYIPPSTEILRPETAPWKHLSHPGGLGKCLALSELHPI